MNSKNSVIPAVAPQKYATLKAGLALTAAGTAAHGAVVSLGSFPTNSEIFISDGSAEFRIGGYTYATTSSVLSSSGYFLGLEIGENFVGQAYRSAGSVVVSVGGVAGSIVFTSFGVGFMGEQPGTDNFVPIQFQDSNINGGNPVVGFAQINFDGINTSVLNLWYVTNGKPIRMVNGEISQVPEPSGLGLLALGAVGVLTRRRRKLA